MHRRMPLLLMILVIAIAGIAAPSAEQSCEPQEEVLRLYDSGIRSERFLIIDNETEWCEFWDKAVRGEPCDLSLVDFHGEVAVVAGLGIRSDTCHDVDVDCILRNGRSPNVKVRVVETQFTVGCMCGAAEVQPVTVVATPKPVRRADFEKVIEEHCCEPDEFGCERDLEPL